MSILSQLFRRKITWQTAAALIETWTTQTVNANPALEATATAVMGDLKQAASDAIATADTLAGPLLATGADAVSAAFSTAATAYLGPFGMVASSAAHDSIARIRDGLKAAIDAEAAALIAQLKPATTTTVAGTVASSVASSVAQQSVPQPLGASPNG